MKQRRRTGKGVVRSCRRRESGASMVESTAALLILCLLFFGMLQIFHWTMQKMFCEYAAYYATKSVALGYRTNFAMRAARVAAIAISGPSRGAYGGSEKTAAEEYMTLGDASGVYYEYWYPQRSDDPELYAWGGGDDTHTSGNVRIKNAPLLLPGLAVLLGIAENPEPTGSVRSYTYSKLYLED